MNQNTVRRPAAAPRPPRRAVERRPSLAPSASAAKAAPARATRRAARDFEFLY